MATTIQIQPDDFKLAELEALLRANDGGSGAVVTFTGIVRELTGGGLKGLFLEHYPGMTERALESIVDKARQRWQLHNVVVIHRIGHLMLNDNIVFVGVGSAHRKDAFAAAQFIMDYLKKDAPFWKKEISPDGDHWVEQKQSDLSAAESWSS